MELWQLDVMGGIWLADGRELKAVTGSDDHSRFCVAAGLIERANAHSVCRIFTQSLDRHGNREELLTDNGKVFTGRLGPHPGEVLFDRICREQGITHRRTGIRAPTTTGKIERFHKTLRAELLTGRRFDSLPQAQQELDAWVADYNTHRPHQALAMAVPAQRFHPATASPNRAPGGPLQPPRPVTLSATEITRRVSASGLIGVCYQQVSAGRHLASQIVTVRLHPTVLQVFHAGQLIRTVPHQGGGPAPSPPAPPAETTTPNHLGSVNHHPEPTGSITWN
jgi:hypothetical protein